MSGPKNDDPAPTPPKSDGDPLPFPWSWIAWLPWIAAVGFALLAGFLGRAYIAARSEISATRTERALADVEAQSMRQQLEAERIIAARRLADGASERDSQGDLTRLVVASLAPASRNGVTEHAIVIWDSVRQQGELAAFGMPGTVSGETYVAWVIESDRSEPVAGGTFTVAQSPGNARVRLRPVVPVTGAVRFAISVESADRMPRAPSPYILTSK